MSRPAKPISSEEMAIRRWKNEMNRLHMRTLDQYHWRAVVLNCMGKGVASRNAFEPIHPLSSTWGWRVLRTKRKNKVCKWAIYDEYDKIIRDRRGRRMSFATPALAIIHAEKKALQRLAYAEVILPRNMGDFITRLQEAA